MKDVAHRAGVSPTTVSHVINETRFVSEELRARVLEAMEELNYQPSAVARSLRRKETQTIGMIVPDSTNPFFAEVARGIEDTSFGQGYSVILCNSDGDMEKEQFYINVLVEKRVDGIIFVAAGGSAQHLRSLLERDMPLVIVDREIAGVEVDSVLTDNLQGGYLATKHLIELGHRRIGCIAGPSDLTPSAERVTGYKRALAEHNLVVNEHLIRKGDFQYESGCEAVREFLTMDEPPTAVFACNDLMAVGAISGVRKRGWRVPEDLAIVGFDDIALASFTNPPLTTIAQPKYEIGILAAQMLMERIKDETMPPRRHLLETTLVVRESCHTGRE
ncbi:MAG: LacI family DNA-binding transcriptional regulator [Anaerolineae bacterium]